MVGGMDEQELQCEVAQIIGTGEEILTAAIFGLQDDYAKILVAGVATGTAAAVAGLDSRSPTTPRASASGSPDRPRPSARRRQMTSWSCTSSQLLSDPHLVGGQPRGP
jgi:hypothetical protein